MDSFVNGGNISLNKIIVGRRIPDNRFFDDFIGYLMEIHEKKYVNHNFHHLL
jgi:hypothetical protein